MQQIQAVHLQMVNKVYVATPKEQRIIAERHGTTIDNVGRMLATVDASDCMSANKVRQRIDQAMSKTSDFVCNRTE